MKIRILSIKMKKEIFYRKYSNMPIGKRFVGKLIMAPNGIEQNYTPSKLYNKIKMCEENIAEEKLRLENLLEAADKIII